MATRSAIAIRNSDATYDVIYCHWDGYPSHQLPILHNKYNTAKKIRRLIAKGDLSVLETAHGWNHEERKAGPLYYFERGDVDCEPRNVSANELLEFAKNCYCEYLYTYLPRWGWRYDKIC
ncbi:MAG: hypothetical protein ACO236_00390 [Candidatus Nanopelagicaceae bacterium]